MKGIILFTILLVSTNLYSQKVVTKKILTSENKNDALGYGWEFIQKIKDDVDTTIYFSMGFQNKKYEYASDISLVFFISKEEFVLFFNKLIEFSEMENAITVSEKLGRHSINLYDFSNDIYIEDSKGKYTYISKSKAKKLANELLLNQNILKD